MIVKNNLNLHIHDTTVECTALNSVMVGIYNCMAYIGDLALEHFLLFCIMDNHIEVSWIDTCKCTNLILNTLARRHLLTWMD